MLVELLMAAISETHVQGVLVICQRSSVAGEDATTGASSNSRQSTRRRFPEGRVVTYCHCDHADFDGCYGKLRHVDR
jgi:hypothetical protein